MDGFVLIALLVLGVVVLTPLADRIGVPQPVLLTIFGLAVDPRRRSLPICD